ncbi:hypothetical protein ABBQ38_011687 [Trebouxia sp. C0009 RCD-2024]
MPSSHQGFGFGLDPQSHTVFTFSWPKPLDWTPMLPLRRALRNVRVKSHSAVTAACEQHVSRAVLPSSDWGSLPQDVLLCVVARLQGRHVVPAVAVCNQWRGLLAQFVTHSKLSQLPLSTPKMDAAQRTGFQVFLSREGMKATRTDACSINPNNTLVALYKHADIRALLDTLASEAMSTFFGGLTRLCNTYTALKELDLSQGVAVMSCEDYANMRRDGYQVHPQGHAALTQQALPISIKALVKHLFPHRGMTRKLLPSLTFLHLRFVKVMISIYNLGCIV